MYPEHTARAYREAARQGADVIECDLAITKVRDKKDFSKQATQAFSRI